MRYIKQLVRVKVYFDRSRMYIGYIQFFMMLLLLFEAYKDTRFGGWFYNNILWAFPLFMILFFCGSVVIGYFDKKYIRPHESSEITQINPVFMEMYRKVTQIHEKVK